MYIIIIIFIRRILIIIFFPLIIIIFICFLLKGFKIIRLFSVVVAHHIFIFIYSYKYRLIVIITLLIPTQKLEPTNNGLYDKLSRHQISAGKTSNGHVNNGGYAAKNGGHMTNGGGGGGHMTNGKGAGQRSWTDGSGDHVGKKMQ